jgi:hypothetical protein
MVEYQANARQPSSFKVAFQHQLQVRSTLPPLLPSSELLPTLHFYPYTL